MESGVGQNKASHAPFTDRTFTCLISVSLSIYFHALGVFTVNNTQFNFTCYVRLAFRPAINLAVVFAWNIK